MIFDNKGTEETRISRQCSVFFVKFTILTALSFAFRSFSSFSFLFALSFLAFCKQDEAGE